MGTQFLACRMCIYVDRVASKSLCPLSWFDGSESVICKRNERAAVTPAVDDVTIKYDLARVSVAVISLVPGHEITSLPRDLRQSIWTLSA